MSASSASPLSATLVDTAAALATGALSSAGLAGDCLAAAERSDHTAFVRLRRDKALLQSASAPPGVLHGLPIAHKDMFHRRGELSECGSRILQGFVAPDTATVLARLDAAGAVDLGALHMAEFAMSPTGFNAHLGHGRNPWSADHVSGGSSSGSGVAVAAGLVCAALGSDTGGSVRLPAAICGVTGIKPTQHRVSVHGVMPLAPSLDCVGFLAASARDCARLLSVVAGADPLDLSCLAMPPEDFEAGIDEPLSGDTVIAVPEMPASAPASDEIRAQLAEAVEVLRAAGAAVRRVPLPDLAELGSLGSLVLGAEAASVHRHWLATRPQDYGDQVRRRIERGLLYPAARYVDALRLRPLLLQQFLLTCLPDNAQALALPVLPHAVPTTVETTEGSEADVEARFGNFSYWTRAINYLGLPAIALPVGFTANGLPNGIQLVGRPCGERALFRLGHHYQQKTDWHLRRPGAERSRGRPSICNRDNRRLT